MNYTTRKDVFGNRPSCSDWHFRTLGVQEPVTGAVGPEEWQSYAETVREHMHLRRRLLLRELRDIINGNYRKEVRHG